MKKDGFTIAEMYETKSQHGRTYFHGQSESGGRFVLKKVHGKKNEKGEHVWILLLVKR